MDKMNRRELITSIVPAVLIPTLTINGMTKAAATRVAPGYYMLFVDPSAVDIEALAATQLPEAGKDVVMDIFAVHVRPGQQIQDAVALYKLPEK